MISLAFNKQGEPFNVPSNTTGWRVMRLRRGRGAPARVFDPDGAQLVLPLAITFDGLRRAVGVPGKYRLDPVDCDSRLIKPSEAAYVMVAEIAPHQPRRGGVDALPRFTPVSALAERIRRQLRGHAA